MLLISRCTIRSLNKNSEVIARNNSQLIFLSMITALNNGHHHGRGLLVFVFPFAVCLEDK